MKEIISYLYKLNIIDEFKYNNQLIYKSDKSNYLFYEVENINNIMFINNCVNILNQNRFFSYKFMLNIYNDIFSVYQEKRFVIIDIGNDYSKEVSFEDMLLFYDETTKILINKIKYKNNWDILWENKINYLINHFNSNYVSMKNYEVIFNYYISIAETALQYLIECKTKYKNNDKISFVHRRINYPNIKFDFYNPLNYIVDLEVRDISEYIKELYYSNENYLIELDFYLKTHNLDYYLASILFSRIIYPSVFFDDYEKNIILVKKYNNFDSYEKFVKKIYDLISSYIQIDSIDWLN